MRPGRCGFAFCCLVLMGGIAAAQPPEPILLPRTRPSLAATESTITAEAPSDPLTDLMKRVTNLEAELRKAKSAEVAKKPTINWMMQIQTDFITNSQDEANRESVGAIPEGAVFRRARVGLFGDYGPWEYRIAMDFALSGRPSFLDVYLGWNDIPGLGRLRVGHFFEPLGFEQVSQNRFLTFLERSLPADPIAPGRSLGVMANNTYATERGTWAVGVFWPGSDVYGDTTSTNFQFAGTGRVTGLAWYDEETQGRDLLHLGLAYSARAPKNEEIQFRFRPEIRLGAATPNIPDFADTGVISASFYQLVATELFLVRGPLSVQSEYILIPVSTNDAGAAYFRSWYVMGSVFLTGENRTYRRSTGTLDRIIPRRDFVKQDVNGLAWGPGAWELALRLSHLDLNSGGITGGRLTDVTVGLNWYLNPYLRVTANYIQAYQSPASGLKGRANFYGLRIGYDF